MPCAAPGATQAGLVCEVRTLDAGTLCMGSCLGVRHSGAQVAVYSVGQPRSQSVKSGSPLQSILVDPPQAAPGRFKLLL